MVMKSAFMQQRAVSFIIRYDRWSAVWRLWEWAGGAKHDWPKRCKRAIDKRLGSMLLRTAFISFGPSIPTILDLTSP